MGENKTNNDKSKGIEMLDNSLKEQQVLRFVINLGNPLLAKNTNGKLQGLSIDLAQRFCQKYGLSYKLFPVENAREAVAEIETNNADIGFLAIDPLREEHLQFTQPYLLIKGCYLVKEESHIHNIEEVDQSGNDVVVGLGSAYDLYLSRHLKYAHIERASSSAEVTAMFLSNNADVAAGVKYQLELDRQKFPGLRLLPGHFMLIQQAMAIGRRTKNELHHQLQAFLDVCLKDGFIAEAMLRHGISGAEPAEVKD